jgi:phosphopantothenoylcysteine decarboxylase
MAKVLLGVTGSVAALKTPELVQSLLAHNHDVKVIATQPSLYFFRKEELPSGILFTDADEWPGQETGRKWERTDSVLHIDLRRWADLLMIAPVDANTLAKLATGISDNCLTSVWRAWDLQRPILLAPAMNTLMWEHPQTVLHLRSLSSLFSKKVPDMTEADSLVKWMNSQCLPIRFVGPIEKALACGDVGQGAMASVSDIVQAAQSILHKVT